MNSEPWKPLVLSQTGASDAIRIESIQTLWSGYGEIVKVQLIPKSQGSVIVKHVSPPDTQRHPRGWNTNLSAQRKLKSYEVETHWYDNWSHLCQNTCRVAANRAVAQVDNQSFIVLEDLDASGFDRRHTHLTPFQAQACLSWLANFHATFLHFEPTGLWRCGTYWHLDTRPDEFAAMQDGAIKQNASRLDALLSNANYQTIVHGDAKVANFCFGSNDRQVAAVDFQYVGGGCGIKDVAYFLGSCFDEHECEKYVPALLDYYFQVLCKATDKNIDNHSLEQEWRSLFAPAWTDFYRFLLGWMPEHAKNHKYTRQLAEETLSKIAS